MVFPWDGDIVMHWVQPSQRTLLDYFHQSGWLLFKFTGSHSYVAGEIVTLDLCESPAFVKGVIEVHEQLFKWHAIEVFTI